MSCRSARQNSRKMMHLFVLCCVSAVPESSLFLQRYNNNHCSSSSSRNNNHNSEKVSIPTSLRAAVHSHRILSLSSSNRPAFNIVANGLFRFGDFLPHCFAAHQVRKISNLCQLANCPTTRICRKRNLHRNDLF